MQHQESAPPRRGPPPHATSLYCLDQRRQARKPSTSSVAVQHTLAHTTMDDRLGGAHGRVRLFFVTVRNRRLDPFDKGPHAALVHPIYRASVCIATNALLGRFVLRHALTIHYSRKPAYIARHRHGQACPRALRSPSSHHRFRKSGFRFSMNAVIPSFLILRSKGGMEQTALESNALGERGLEGPV